MRKIREAPEQADGSHLGMASVPQAAVFLSVSKPTVYKAIQEGLLPERRICGAIRVPWAALLKLARSEGATSEVPQ